MVCAKQTVTARIIALDGKEYIGTNWCKNPQTICPRELKNMKTGEGYHLCKSICQQQSHAEIDAITKAGQNAIGATLYLSGHTYACNDCKAAARCAGIKEIIIC